MIDFIEKAIEKIKNVGDRTCMNQLSVFDEYSYNPSKASGDASGVFERLGIPYTDEWVIEYPANRMFSPMAESKIVSFEKTLGALLPVDYKRLLATFGTFHLPGNADICIHSPTTAINVTYSAWCYDESQPLSVLDISSFHQHCDGDSIGFIRNGEQFGPELYVFKHEKRYLGDDPALWTEQIADSFALFVITYIDALEP